MYNLLQYSKNYRKTTGSLWNYYRNEPSDHLSSNSESVKYKTIITGNTYNLGDDNADYDPNKTDKNKTEIVVPLKHLSNLGRTSDTPLINCEIELILTWFQNCVLADMTVRAAGYNDDLPAIVAPTGLEFQITDTKLCVSVITLSTENDKKLSEQLKLGSKRTVKWNKYISKMTIQSNNSNLDYLIDGTFSSANRLFVLSFARNARGDHKDSFSNYYVSNVEIKDFNDLIDGKSFFDLLVKNKEKYAK